MYIFDEYLEGKKIYKNGITSKKGLFKKSILMCKFLKANGLKDVTIKNKLLSSIEDFYTLSDSEESEWFYEKHIPNIIKASSYPIKTSIPISITYEIKKMLSLYSGDVRTIIFIMVLMIIRTNRPIFVKKSEIEKIINKRINKDSFDNAMRLAMNDGIVRHKIIKYKDINFVWKKNNIDKNENMILTHPTKKLLDAIDSVDEVYSFVNYSDINLIVKDIFDEVLYNKRCCKCGIPMYVTGKKRICDNCYEDDRYKSGKLS